LIGITGMINFMLDTNLTVEQLDYAHTIQQSADALLLVINDILDLSKVEAGMMKLAMEPFSVHTMIEDANELLSTLAIQKGLELNFIVEDDVPDVICGDRIRLRQVLLNVIGNAIKFTSDGEVFSKCSIEKMDNENNEVTLLFQVVDTGTGFDAEEEAVMFKPFSQVDTSSTRKHGGSGLGLVISRQLIELHGGKMSCKSQKGVGSTFYFSAKFNVPPESTTPRPQTPTTEVSNSPFFRYSRASVESSSTYGDNPPSSTSTASSILSGCSLNDPGNNSNNNSSGTYSFLPKDSSHTSTVSIQDNSGEMAHGTVSPPSSSRPITPNSRPNTPSLKAREKKQIDLSRPACVLIVAQLPRSRETLVHYVRSILPKEPEPVLYISLDYQDANERLTQSDVKTYTHILINLVSQAEVISLAATIKNSPNLESTDTVILTTPIERAGIMEGAQGELPKRVDFIFKPPNRSKMEGLFDATTTVRENFLKRRNTHQIVASQKEIFKRMADDVGGRGLRVLLVEDNFVNQKVLTRYLNKVGLDVTVANNGVQCLDEFYSHPHDYFALILCDLFMPVKDGYETAREVRAWEAAHLTLEQKGIPIIALSANVFSDVASKCNNAGFNTYVSKPVNFASLSDVIRSVLNSDDGTTRSS
jgi:CheY-like chemotaxis protein